MVHACYGEPNHQRNLERVAPRDFVKDRLPGTWSDLVARVHPNCSVHLASICTWEEFVVPFVEHEQKPESTKNEERMFYDRLMQDEHQLVLGRIRERLALCRTSQEEHKDRKKALREKASRVLRRA